MKSPLTKLAIAAVVLLACGIGLSLWRTTGSGIALADVLARVEKVKAVRYKWTNEIAHHTDPDKPYHVEIRATSLNSREYGTKSNQEWLDPIADRRHGEFTVFAEEGVLQFAVKLVPFLRIGFFGCRVDLIVQGRVTGPLKIVFGIAA